MECQKAARGHCKCTYIQFHSYAKELTSGLRHPSTLRSCRILSTAGSRRCSYQYPISSAPNLAIAIIQHPTVSSCEFFCQSLIRHYIIMAGTRWTPSSPANQHRLAERAGGLPQGKLSKFGRCLCADFSTRSGLSTATQGNLRSINRDGPFSCGSHGSWAGHSANDVGHKHHTLSRTHFSAGRLVACRQSQRFDHEALRLRRREIAQHQRLCTHVCTHTFRCLRCRRVGRLSSCR